MKNSKTLDLQDELHFYEIAQKIIFYFFLAYLGLSILLGLVLNISLTLDFPVLSQLALGAFLGIGVFIQIRRYFLFRRKGQAAEFLKKRGLILGLVITFVVISLILLNYFTGLF